MFDKLINSLTNLVVLKAKKEDSSRKTFYELTRRAYKESADFIYTKISSAILFNKSEKFWKYCLDQILPEGLIMEFGVFQGYSINYSSGVLKNKNDARTVYGFDSFEGLSEEWGGTAYAKGHFDIKGVLPKVNDNVKLIKGWIDKTFPEFVIQQDIEKKKIAFMNIDVDTYTPTKLILELSQKYFVPGTIIVFDELFGYPGWKEHEFKALTEVLDPSWNYEYIAFSEMKSRGIISDHIKTAIKITGRKA